MQQQQPQPAQSHQQRSSSVHQLYQHFKGKVNEFQVKNPTQNLATEPFALLSVFTGEEIKAAFEILRAAKEATGGQAEAVPEFQKLRNLVSRYFQAYQLQQQQHQQKPPVAAVPPTQILPEQRDQVRSQIHAFQRIAAQQPPVVPAAVAYKAQAKLVQSEPTVDPYSNLVTTPHYSKQYVVVPSVMPTGLDPVSLVAERERRIRSKIQFRIKQLEDAPVLTSSVEAEDDENGQSDAKLKALIELKALRLLEKQKKLRRDVIQMGLTAKKGSTLQTAVSRLDYRRVKKPSVKEIRHTERLERQHRQEREKKEKMKQIEWLNSVCNHGKDMLSLRRSQANKQVKLGKAILNWHSTIEKEEAKKEERLSKERIRALKADDEEAYMKLINKQKDTRLTHLLKQTDQYLEKLVSLVQAQKNDIASRDGSLPVPVAESVAAATGDDDEKVDYYLLAHKVREEIKEQPNILIGGKLKEYQLKGLEWLVSLYNNKLNGILADEMGLGKTIQTISLIAYLIEKKNQNGPFLIIVPLSTITNWALEFEKWTPSIIKVVYKGTPNQRRDIQMNEMRHNNFNVLLTTFEYIIKDKAALSKIKWVHTIIDEGHRMKNASSKLSLTLTQFYSSRYRIILTGTPLQNNLPELWALLNFTLPKVFNSVKSFDEWFNTPFANTGEKIELNEEEQLLIIKRLHKVLRPFLLRRLKKDVEKDLPDKIERVLKTPLSALQQKLYSQVRRSGAMLVNNSDDSSKKGVGVKSINNKIMQLRKICNHPYVFSEVEDAINLQGITDEMIVRTSGKFELLDRMLPKLKATGHRVLMFFQMTAVMTIMEDFLSWKGLKYLRLDGSTKTEDRSGMLKLFNAPDSEYFCFILSTRAGGLGLNLQTADTVIIFDSDWNPHQDLQAQDRAHRIGQTKEVRIFRLISANSIEETILARAQYKLDIDGKVIQAGKFDNKSSNEERETMLRSLFETNPEDANDIQDLDDDDELNEILARNEEEMEVFKVIDAEKKKEMEEYWRARRLKGEPSRLITLDELPDVYLHDAVPEENPNEILTFGRGQRSRGTVRYDDGLTEDQWARAVDNDEDPDEVAERKRKIMERRKERGESIEGVSDTESFVSGAASSAVKGKRKRVVEESDSEIDHEGQSKGDAIPKVRVKLNLGGDAGSKKTNGTPAKNNPLSRVFDRSIGAIRNSIAVLEDGTERSRCELFEELPSRKDYPDYYKVIHEPIAIKTIESKINSGAYSSIAAFKKDVDRMFANAKIYNAEESVVYEDATTMQKEFEEELSKAAAELNAQTQ